MTKTFCLLLLLGALYGGWLVLRSAWSKLRADPEWTAQDKAWALALIERTPCTCTRLQRGEYARCERCDFLRKFRGVGSAEPRETVAP